MSSYTLSFEKISDYISENNYNSLINYLYRNINLIIELIEKSNNPQSYEDFDIYTAIYYYKDNPVHPNDQYMVPIIINRLVHYIIRKRSILELDGNKEIAYQNNYKFFTTVVDRDVTMKLFMLQIMFFYYESLYEYQNRRIYFVGIDFEFNDQKIALCQICLFPRKSKKYIWIFDPRELDSTQRNYLINFLYTPQNIYKILHGSDSLDIPYLFNIFFNKNKKIILNFISRLIDTRFICEYHKIASNHEDKKCSIYDALLYFGTITDKKYYSLNDITNKMGKVYQITWDVHNMSEYHIEYALYDVLYLREFLFDMLRKSKKDTPQIHKQLELVPEFTRFIFLEKWDIEDLLVQIKAEVDKINNYFIVENNKEYKLNDIFNYVISDRKFDIIIIVNNLLNINYFKSSITLLLKYIVYSIITNNYFVHESKQSLYELKLNYNLLFTYFKELKMKKIMDLLDKFIKISKNVIAEYIN